MAVAEWLCEMRTGSGCSLTLGLETVLHLQDLGSFEMLAVIRLGGVCASVFRAWDC